MKQLYKSDFIHSFHTGNLEAAVFQKSSTDRETLFQLKQLIHQSSVPTDLNGNMKPAEDFLLIALHRYIIAAASLFLTSDLGQQMFQEG